MIAEARVCECVTFGPLEFDVEATLNLQSMELEDGPRLANLPDVSCDALAYQLFRSRYKSLPQAQQKRIATALTGIEELAGWHHFSPEAITAAVDEWHDKQPPPPPKFRSKYPRNH